MVAAEFGLVGQRKLPRADGPNATIVEELAKLETTDLSDAMRQANTVAAGIRPLYLASGRFAGPAITVAVPAGSQEARRAAMAVARPGDVLVIAARGVASYAVLGGRLARMLRSKGLAGVLVDGYVRDAREIEDVGLPVLCRGQCASAAPKTGPGEVNVPVACGDVVVGPGDVVVGDSDGAVIVPREAAAEVLAAARSLRDKPTGVTS